MAELRIVWDEGNLHHLLVERADRAITPEEVQEVLMDPFTVVEPGRHGRDRYLGRTASGRCLAVIGLGDEEVRPETAWEITEKRWRAAHDR